MKLELIRNLCEDYDGGLKKLASDIDMSEANLHRCINNNKITANDLEKIAIILGVDISIFFSDKAIKKVSKPETKVDTELIDICKMLVHNYQQRDTVMSKLISMVDEL